MKLEFTRIEKILLGILSALALIALYMGWSLFWFLTDDSFIEFRYVSNSILGHGYVWNAPPFHPVEGYTSFLWVFILDLVWRLTSYEPPVSANWLLLFFSALNLFLNGYAVLWVASDGKFRRYRLIFLALYFVWVLTNRTFLAWSSSGLEASLFNLLFSVWIFSAIYFPTHTRQWLFAICLSAALVYLTRPDGLLITVVTIALIGISLFTFRDSPSALGRRRVLAASPLLIVPIHFVWRKIHYGAWLPNTYYAKHIEGRFWITSGYRYFLTFVIEYALWFWIAIALLLIVYLAVAQYKKQSIIGSTSSLLPILAVVLTIIVHISYYTVVIGGDHFEFRIYSYLIPLLFVSAVYMLRKLEWLPRISLIYLSIFILASWPIPWAHWFTTKEMYDRSETLRLKQSVARAIQKKIPLTGKIKPLMTYLDWYDQMQFWLINHSVCMRHQEHKAFWLIQTAKFPTREEGMLLDASDYPIFEAPAVGVSSWALPTIAVLDLQGLNDYIIARNPILRKNPFGTNMAHERQPPAGYVECLQPNVKFNGVGFEIIPRRPPMTANDIIQCEQAFEKVVENSH